jgi:site-specific DNA-cytosine methylase
MRVADWEQPSGTVTGAGRVSGGAIAVADPRLAQALELGENDARHKNKFGVRSWDEPMPTVTSTGNPGGGAPSVADPRWGGGRLGVTGWTEPSGTVAGESLPNNGRFAVADPRPPWQHVAGVTPWTEPAPTVTGGAKIHAGAFQVADPRVQEWLARSEAIDWLQFGCAPRAGAYGVLRWDEAAATITGSADVDNGRAAVADPRLRADRPPPFTPIIIAADGTWHRPLTTLELGALQGFPTVVDGRPLVLSGDSHTGWRERIGNAVPPWDLVHVELGPDGGVVPCDGPSCWQCSREILDVGFVGGVWLYEHILLAPGRMWRRYPAEEFYRVTLENCGMVP